MQSGQQPLNCPRPRPAAGGHPLANLSSSHSHEALYTQLTTRSLDTPLLKRTQVSLAFPRQKSTKSPLLLTKSVTVTAYCYFFFIIIFY